jgi:hypothetical protein
LENISGLFGPLSSCCKPRPISFTTFFAFIYCVFIGPAEALFETVSAANKFTRSK